MRAAALVMLLPLSAMAGEPAAVPGLDAEASVRAMSEAAREEQAANPPASAPGIPAHRTAPSGTAPTHVPLPLKTITIQDLAGVQNLADELESTRREASERR